MLQRVLELEEANNMDSVRTMVNRYSQDRAEIEEAYYTTTPEGKRAKVDMVVAKDEAIMHNDGNKGPAFDTSNPSQVRSPDQVAQEDPIINEEVRQLRYRERKPGTYEMDEMGVPDTWLPQEELDFMMQLDHSRRKGEIPDGPLNWVGAEGFGIDAKNYWEHRAMDSRFGSPVGGDQLDWESPAAEAFHQEQNHRAAKAVDKLQRKIEDISNAGGTPNTNMQYQYEKARVAYEMGLYNQAELYADRGDFDYRRDALKDATNPAEMLVPSSVLLWKAKAGLAAWQSMIAMLPAEFLLSESLDDSGFAEKHPFMALATEMAFGVLGGSAAEIQFNKLNSTARPFMEGVGELPMGAREPIFGPRVTEAIQSVPRVLEDAESTRLRSLGQDNLANAHLTGKQLEANEKALIELEEDLTVNPIKIGEDPEVQKSELTLLRRAIEQNQEAQGVLVAHRVTQASTTRSVSEAAKETLIAKDPYLIHIAPALKPAGSEVDEAFRAVSKPNKEAIFMDNLPETADDGTPIDAEAIIAEDPGPMSPDEPLTLIDEVKAERIEKAEAEKLQKAEAKKPAKAPTKRELGWTKTLTSMQDSAKQTRTTRAAAKTKRPIEPEPEIDEEALQLEEIRALSPEYSAESQVAFDTIMASRAARQQSEDGFNLATQTGLSGKLAPGSNMVEMYANFQGYQFRKAVDSRDPNHPYVRKVLDKLIGDLDAEVEYRYAKGDAEAVTRHIKAYREALAGQRQAYEANPSTPMEQIHSVVPGLTSSQRQLLRRKTVREYTGELPDLYYKDAKAFQEIKSKPYYIDFLELQATRGYKASYRKLKASRPHAAARVEKQARRLADEKYQQYLANGWYGKVFEEDVERCLELWDSYDVPVTHSNKRVDVFDYVAKNYNKIIDMVVEARIEAGARLLPGKQRSFILKEVDDREDYNYANPYAGAYFDTAQSGPWVGSEPGKDQLRNQWARSQKAWYNQQVKAAHKQVYGEPVPHSYDEQEAIYDKYYQKALVDAKAAIRKNPKLELNQREITDKAASDTAKYFTDQASRGLRGAKYLEALAARKASALDEAADPAEINEPDIAEQLQREMYEELQTLIEPAKIEQRTPAGGSGSKRFVRKELDLVDYMVTREGIFNYEIDYQFGAKHPVLSLGHTPDQKPRPWPSVLAFKYEDIITPKDIDIAIKNAEDGLLRTYRTEYSHKHLIENVEAIKIPSGNFSSRTGEEYLKLPEEVMDQVARLHGWHPDYLEDVTAPNGAEYDMWLDSGDYDATLKPRPGEDRTGLQPRKGLKPTNYTNHGKDMYFNYKVHEALLARNPNYYKEQWALDPKLRDPYLYKQTYGYKDYVWQRDEWLRKTLGLNERTKPWDMYKALEPKISLMLSLRRDINALAGWEEQRTAQLMLARWRDNLSGQNKVLNMISTIVAKDREIYANQTGMYDPMTARKIYANNVGKAEASEYQVSGTRNAIWEMKAIELAQDQNVPLRVAREMINESNLGDLGIEQRGLRGDDVNLKIAEYVEQGLTYDEAKVRALKMDDIARQTPRNKHFLSEEDTEAAQARETLDARAEEYMANDPSLTLDAAMEKAYDDLRFYQTSQAFQERLPKRASAEDDTEVGVDVDAEEEMRVQKELAESYMDNDPSLTLDAAMERAHEEMLFYKANEEVEYTQSKYESDEAASPDDEESMGIETSEGALVGQAASRNVHQWMNEAEAIMGTKIYHPKFVPNGLGSGRFNLMRLNRIKDLYEIQDAYNYIVGVKNGSPGTRYINTLSNVSVKRFKNRFGIEPHSSWPRDTVKAMYYTMKSSEHQLIGYAQNIAEGRGGLAAAMYLAKQKAIHKGLMSIARDGKASKDAYHSLNAWKMEAWERHDRIETMGTGDGSYSDRMMHDHMIDTMTKHQKRLEFDAQWGRMLHEIEATNPNEVRNWIRNTLEMEEGVGYGQYMLDAESTKARFDADIERYC